MTKLEKIAVAILLAVLLPVILIGATYHVPETGVVAASAGAGLTESGGVLAVGEGTGISVSANAIAIDVTDALSWSGVQTFTNPLVLPAGAVGTPALAPTGDANTGVYFSAADTFDVSTGGTNRLSVSTTGVTSSLPVIHAAGAVGTPSMTFTGDLNNGIYAPAADQLAIANAGVQSLLSTTTGVTTTVPIFAPTGSAANPSISFSGDTDTGLFNTSAGGNSIDVVVQGTTKWRADNNKILNVAPVHFQNGSVSAPSLTNLNDTNTGWFFSAAETIDEATNGVLRRQISTSVESVFLPRETRVHAAFAGSGAFISSSAIQTTTNAQTTLFSFTLSDTFVCSFEALVTARQTDASDRATFKETSSVYREGGGATLTVGVSELVSIRSAGAVTSAWAATWTVNSNDARLSVTGADSETINWVAAINYQCVSGST